MLLDQELAELSDTRVLTHIQTLLVDPVPVQREWDYGYDGEKYPCWNVLEHKPSNTGVAYCENGFGPRSPWGLVFLEGDLHLAIGMDCSWYTTFLQAYFESQAACELTIWQVFETDSSGAKKAITDEMDWDETWAHVMSLRASNLESRYDCDTSISYKQE